MRAWLLALVVAGCGAAPGYTGTYSGDFFIGLTPVPLVGNPSGTGTVTLTQAGASVSGSFAVTVRSGSQMTTSTGMMSGTVGAKNAIDDLTVVVDMFSPSCTPPQFTAHGQAFLFDDTQAGAMRLQWTASGTSTCGGASTEVDLTCVPGMKRQ